MTRRIYVNLPVADLDRSKAFYTALGFAIEPNFTNENAACMVWSETIHVMLLTHDFWKTFTTKTIPDAKVSAQVLLAIDFDSRDAVDAIVDAAEASGGVSDCNPQQDHGWMYGRSFEDPDGHVWEPSWMDLEAALNSPQAPGAQA